MFKSILACLTVAVIALPSCASAQGTKDPSNGSNSATNSTRTTGSGVSTNETRDSMGGAFKGTGMPNWGTSPGMGSDTKSRRN